MRIQRELKEKQILEQIVAISEEFLQFDSSELNYQKITDNILDISGAKYAGFNLYDEGGSKFTTVAFSAPEGIIKKASSLLGFKLLGKKWNHDPVRAEKIKSHTINRFSTLSELVGDLIAKPVVSLLEKTFNIGEVVLVKILRENVMIGDFTFFMPSNVMFKNDNYVEIYTRQVGLLISHKKVKEALLESKKQYRTLFETITDGVVLIAPDGQIVQANPAAEHILGLKYSEIKERKYDSPEWEILRPDGTPMPPKERAVFRVMREKRSVKDVIMGLKRSSGFVSWINVNAFPILDEARELNGVVATLQDITEHKQAEEALRESEEIFRSFMEYSPIYVFFKDENIRALQLSKNYETMLGKPIEELLGKGMFDLFPPELAKTMVEDDMRILKAGQVVNVEEELNGRSYSTTKFPIFIEGKPLFLAGYTIDITERKKLEDKLKQAANHDSLTGLYSRSFFEEEMKLLSKEREISIGLIVLDIDGLKYINDILGHQEGDKLLINLSKILLATFRPSDVIARIGGDEFAVLIRDVDNNKLNETAQRLNNNILAYNQKLKSYQNPIHVSAGYAIKDVPTKKIEQVLKEADDMLFKEKIPKREDVRKSILNVIKTTMLEKDLTTKERIGRLTSLASSFSDAMNLSDEEKRKLILTTELHDIGKIVIPDDVLNKRGKLSFEDFEHIKKHPEAGYRIAMAIPEISHVAEYILYSHERWDGKGYPKELIGEEIPLISRMTLIIDAYDAITNNRPYRKASSIKQAINELKYNAGTQFDPELIDIFVNKVIFNI